MKGISKIYVILGALLAFFATVVTVTTVFVCLDKKKKREKAELEQYLDVAIQ